MSTSTRENYYTQAYEARRSANAARRAEAERQAEEEAAEQTRRQRAQTQAANLQLYSDYMNSLRTLPEELSARGITGGLAESGRVRLASEYMGGVNGNESARRRAEQDIAAAAQGARSKAAATESQDNASAQDAYYTRLAELAGDREKQSRQDAASTAEQLAAVGDYSGYVAMGLLTAEQAALLRQAWIARNGKLAAALGYTKAARKGGTAAGTTGASAVALGAPAATGGQVAQEWR